MVREGYIKRLREMVGTEPLLMPSVATFVHDRGRVLVGRHRDLDLWVLPGGGAEPGETPPDCAVREVWEETGLVVAITGVRGAFGGTLEHRVEYPNGDICDYVVTVFDAVVAGGELRAETDELAELRWVTLDELAAMPTASWLRPVLANPAGWEPVRWAPPPGSR